MSRRAFLHIGFGKTGTSVIQAALEALRPQLAAAGICYPVGFGGTGERAARGKAASGNAVALGWLVSPGDRRPGYDEAAVLAWLADAIAGAGGRDLLFSSEFLQLPAPALAAALCRRLADAGYDVHVLCHVRHALDQAIATYLQALKRGMLAEKGLANLDGFIRDTAACPYLAGLDAYAAALPPGRLMVALYEAERDELVARFLARLTPHALAIPPVATQVMNRSPDAAEQAVFRALARHPDGRRLCVLAADLLLDRPGAGDEGPTVSPEALAAYTARNRHVVEQVNLRYLSDGRLRIASDRVRIGTPPPPDPDAALAAFADCFAALVAQRRAARPGAPPPARNPA